MKITLVVSMVGWDLTALIVRHYQDVRMENVWIIQILAFVKRAGKDLFAMNHIVGENFISFLQLRSYETAA